MLMLMLPENGDTYEVRIMKPDPPYVAAFELRKFGTPAVWHVSVDRHGPACDCPDSIYRNRNNQPDERKCKHVRQLIEDGLL